ncbi:2-carboxy-1,4-naphthoquinone phytyltransferase, chloroplastic [Amborella trichopoda]|nr:2-carboxy-1,4-naphthoquinone phytyltransferase, chloroplastic [Amborella trichopoda]|eukprot:XP_020528279.1 2-carboxy-1,4-naphthoquinone phytyltransferase, chloroplastic [Amborella trichopoda]
MAFAAPFSCSLLCFSPTNLSKTFLRPFNGNPTSNLCTTQRLLGRGIRNGRRYTEIIGVSESSSFLGSNEPAIKASGLGRDDGEELSKATLLWRAVKLPIYSVALVPLTVGGAAAYLQTGFFAARRYLVLLLASASIITWLNLRIEGDLAVGKMSPLVQIGTEKGSKVVKFSILILYSFLFVLGALRALPLTCVVLCTLTLPIGKLVVDYVQDNHNDKTKIFMAKYYCVRLHALFGIALAIGLAMARRMAHFLNEGTRRSFVFRGSTWFLPFLLEFFRGT